MHLCYYTTKELEIYLTVRFELFSTVTPEQFLLIENAITNQPRGREYVLVIKSPKQTSNIS